MNAATSTVLHIDLAKKESITKSYPDLIKYVGGVGLASHLVLEEFESDPLVFAAGPLNGFFPFASKACAAFAGPEGFLDTYVGGRFSTRLRFCGTDAIVFENTSTNPVVLSVTDNEASFFPAGTDTASLGLLGNRTILEVKDGKAMIDGNFSFGDGALSKKLERMGVVGIVVSGSQVYPIENPDRYNKLYYEILHGVKDMLVVAGNAPSCSGCPMGCHKSLVGETGGNVLVHSLVSCVYSEAIYSSIPTVFACLNTLGYTYSHEDLEALPSLVYSSIERINEKITNR